VSHLFYQTRGRRPTLDRAAGIHMWDTEGRRYIDGASGAMVCNIGHSNPAVLAAMRGQMERATFGYRLQFETEAAGALAARTANLCPPALDRVFFVSGGSEAVESAVKLARAYAVATGAAGRWKVISRHPSYHGCTLGALGLTGYDPLTEPYAPMMRASPKVPAPTAWLDGRDPDDPATGRHYAEALDATIRAEGPSSVLAFIVEPIGGASTGALVPPAGYMEAIREICDGRGVLLIHDEVMSGGGRTASWAGTTGRRRPTCWPSPRGSVPATPRSGRWWRGPTSSRRCSTPAGSATGSPTPETRSPAPPGSRCWARSSGWA
jgi:adenosylmethionine-8-amino-7-oxononanoate aminotransferase